MDPPVRNHGIATTSNLPDHHPYTRQQPALVNPTTPLAFLPPDVAFHVTIAIYILVLTCAVFIWDILSNLRTEYEHIRNRGCKSLALIVYMVSRLASLGFILAATIYATAPAGDCATFDKVVDWFYPVAVSSTAFYFFLRLRAVYLQRRRVVLIFGFLWLAVLGSCLTATQGGDGTNIGSTRYCIISDVDLYVAAATIVPLFYDLAVFSAISYHLLYTSHTPGTIAQQIRSMVSGEGMRHVHRTLLKGGQWYIMATLTTGVLTIVMFFLTSAPAAYRMAFLVPNVALMNIMACKVVRHLRAEANRGANFGTNESIPEELFAHPSRDSIQMTTFARKSARQEPDGAQFNLSPLGADQRGEGSSRITLCNPSSGSKDDFSKVRDIVEEI